MQLPDFLIEVVKHTNGWVIVLVFGLYVGYHIYRKHSDGIALRILESTIKSLLENVDRKVSILTTKVDQFLSKL